MAVTNVKTRLVACAAIAVLVGASAAACTGARSTSHPDTTTPSAPSQTTGGTQVSVPLPPGFGSGLWTSEGTFIRFPRAWYAQNYYTASQVLITTYPIHNPMNAVADLPPSGALIELFDSRLAHPTRQIPKSAGPHRLGKERPYEGVGASYRLSWYQDHHGLLILVKFGSRASTTTRATALNIINHLHIETPAVRPG
jgi:hypothetical protein